jgi:hypothetical protein
LDEEADCFFFDCWVILLALRLFDLMLREGVLSLFISLCNFFLRISWRSILALHCLRRELARIRPFGGLTIGPVAFLADWVFRVLLLEAFLTEGRFVALAVVFLLLFGVCLALLILRS